MPTAKVTKQMSVSPDLFDGLTVNVPENVQLSFKNRDSETLNQQYDEMQGKHHFEYRTWITKRHDIGSISFTKCPSPDRCGKAVSINLTAAKIGPHPMIESRVLQSLNRVTPKSRDNTDIDILTQGMKPIRKPRFHPRDLSESTNNRH